jgi:hypothetical protein
MEWKKPLESSEALKGKRREKSSRFNAQRWTVQTRGVSMGHVTDAGCAMPHDISRNHYGDHKKSKRRDVTLRHPGQSQRGSRFRGIQVLRSRAPANSSEAAPSQFGPGAVTSRDGWQSTP